jgi:DNA invertase Pin-like site-specific DNA recombinase
MIHGYARVSAKDQKLGAQHDALQAAGAEKLYCGDGRHRPGLQRMLKALEPGDTVLVTRLDRLARSTRDLLNTLEAIGQAGATFKSLADTWADTTTAHGRLILTVLGGLAAYERELIKARTGEGRTRAKANGVHFGPKFKLTPHQRKEAKQRHDNGETYVDIGKSMNVSYMTVARAVARMESVQ